MSTTKKFPDGISIKMAAKEDSERYYFRTPLGSIASVPSTSVELAREMIADEYRGFSPSDFEQVDGFDAEMHEYPDPIDCNRDINEYDIWSLKHSMTNSVLEKKLTSRRSPTDKMIEAILDHWSTPSDIPLDDFEALQEAHGIGEKSAGRIVGSAVAARLIERPKR